MWSAPLQDMPFCANGELSRFGVGSKKAGFFYGSCLTAVSSIRRGAEAPAQRLRGETGRQAEQGG